MTRSIFSQPQFNDEAAAYAFVEARLWANGRPCPHCGVFDRSGALKGKDDRIGLYKCYACRKKFTVKIGTIFEDSHIQMRDWLTAIHLICSSKKGFSANQLSRTLGITLKSAWFLGHRIREAMRSGDLSPLGGSCKTVEIDETFIGRLADVPKQRHGYAHKNVVLTLVERGGAARSFHVDTTTVGTLIPIIRANVAHETAMMTDQASWYKNLNKDGEFALDILSETIGTARLVLRAVKGSADRDCSATLIATIQGRDLRVWRMDWRPVHSHTNRCGGKEYRGLTSETGVHAFGCNAKLGLERMQSEDLPICIPVEDDPHDFDAFVRYVSNALKIAIADQILGPPWSLRLL